MPPYVAPRIADRITVWAEHRCYLRLKRWVGVVAVDPPMQVFLQPLLDGSIQINRLRAGGAGQP
ncbi:hypothetical protein HJG54_04455 [Leptolyngbya sp. NK1-12]|uniref:Uncharacterized protein n=1 Tax=Leptolyngbya sp. NK1-12 TaxID=2547451 RepID=A0AA97AIV1_9CYAN|nr:hypothetical protein [Leptolyngbya sp. NK1-12]WNZ22187.1 hypothetical protein HJG54_04455 [Leptolyngbya sp. NK1-12]